MKYIKITLAIIVTVAICTGIYFWVLGIDPPPPTPPAENQYTSRIEQKIDSLKNRSDSDFGNVFYDNIKSEIEIFHLQNKLGNSISANDQVRLNLEKTLYSVYINNFIEKAQNVLSGSNWARNDRTFIQNEINRLRNERVMNGDRLLVAYSPMDSILKEIKKALDKYSEISSFINECSQFSYTGNTLSDRFPINEVRIKINRAWQYLNSNLENSYVNNCNNLRTGLQNIPHQLFQKHVSYLENKINNWTDMYPYYENQKDFSNNLYSPISSEIEDLYNNIYPQQIIHSEYERLKSIWDDENIKAFNHDF